MLPAGTYQTDSCGAHVVWGYNRHSQISAWARWRSARACHWTTIYLCSRCQTSSQGI